MDSLIHAATEVRLRAHAPHSRFQVGAAVECDDGRVFTGCNVENATLGLTICAERLAVFKAISDGVKPGGFRRVAVVAGTPILTPPCGACRQILWEFCGDIDLTLANLTGLQQTLPLRTLLPLPFDAGMLK